MTLDDGVAPTFAGRLIESLFGTPGGCMSCRPRRVPAQYEVWITVWDPESYFADEEGPSTERCELCVDCTARERLNTDPAIFVARVRDLL